MGAMQSTSSSGVQNQRTSIYRDNLDSQVASISRKGKRSSSSSLATLRRRLLLKRRRASKSPDHAKHFRELVTGWSISDISSLCEQYEALSALKDLSVQADLARPPASGKKLDLCSLFESKLCSDIEILFNGVCFPAHRAILSARCPYFRQILARCPGFGARICLDIRTPGIDMKMFNCLLKFLYTGELDCQSDLPSLARLADEFGGTPNPLDQDLRYLLETGDFADAMLVFYSSESEPSRHQTQTQSHHHQHHHHHHRHLSSGTGSSSSSSSSGNSEYGFSSLSTLELPCHKAVLASRSVFFRNLVERRNRGEELQPERAGLNLATRIVLDESVISQKFAKVLLHAIYLDIVDLSLISRPTSMVGTSSSCDYTINALEDAMELYQIGRFLELDILSQGCEDLLLEMLEPQTLPALLNWSSQPYGSTWVRRQAVNYLREEFSTIAQSPVLFQLTSDNLKDALSSDFLQASELEVLQAVLRWGEHQLLRRLEDREPNILSHTAHSVARKGIKKRDFSDIELREILSPLLPLVRMDHVLPINSLALNQAIRRGLVPTPPSHMLGGDSESLRINAWIQTNSGSSQGLFIRPRLFMPYYEEIKCLIEDQYQQGLDLVRANRAAGRLRRGDNPDIPDTLYMVEERSRPPEREPSCSISDSSSLPPVPDPNTMNQMLKREQKLRQSPLVIRALSLPLTSRHLIFTQVRLRVAREFNLPDATAQLLENGTIYYKEGEDCETRSSSELDSPLAPSTSSLRGSLRNNTLPSLYSRRSVESVRAMRAITADSLELHSSEGTLSEIMPDVAMLSSSFSHLSLDQSEIELDLGDGHYSSFYYPSRYFPHRNLRDPRQF